MAEHGQIVRPVVHAVSSGVFVHGHVEAPVQTVLDAPMAAHDFAAAFSTRRLELILKKPARSSYIVNQFQMRFPWGGLLFQLVDLTRIQE